MTTPNAHLRECVLGKADEGTIKICIETRVDLHKLLLVIRNKHNQKILKVHFRLLLNACLLTAKTAFLSVV